MLYLGLLGEDGMEIEGEGYVRVAVPCWTEVREKGATWPGGRWPAVHGVAVFDELESRYPVSKIDLSWSRRPMPGIELKFSVYVDPV